ncbi:MAG: hypothetical protein AAF571_12355 [Verrucomicrobiota bacterium]
MNAFHPIARISLILMLTLASSTLVTTPGTHPVTGSILFFICAIGGYTLIRYLFKRFQPAMDQNASDQAAHLDRLDQRQIPALLVTATAISLFYELSVIRWLASVYPMLALFKNFTLISCFCGLGLGYALSRHSRIYLLYSPLLLLAQMVFFTILDFVNEKTVYLEQQELTGLYFNPIAERFAIGLNTATDTFSGSTLVFYIHLAAAILPTILIFIPVGQICGRLMTPLPQLKAYGLNLLGSCAGVIAMLIAGYFWTSPTIWFLVIFGSFFLFIPSGRKTVLYLACTCVLVTTVLQWPAIPEKHQIYSPYQLLEVKPPLEEDAAISISAAGYYHQKIFDLSQDNQNRLTNQNLRNIASHYDLPYHFISNPNARILIVGSGTGNDVAAALRSGPAHVDAVEIDPAILHLGERYHPERPYQSPVVKTHANDARTFFSTATEPYDLIVFGLLDSHTLLSHASSVRLDSFVYTLQAMEQCRDLLTEDGVLCLSFAIMNDTLGKKLYETLKLAFDGKPPVSLKTSYDGSSVAFLQNKQGTLTLAPEQLDALELTNVAPRFYNSELPDIDISTDDWPFLYMPQKTFPVSYIYVLIFLMLIFSICIYLFRPSSLKVSHLSYFFLGAGFMLIQTKAITELGLYFGNTWNVIGIVIVVLLMMAFFANLLVSRYSFKTLTFPFIGLIGLLIGGYAVMVTGNAPQGLGGKLGVTLLLLSPIFFSGIIFSTLLKHKDDIGGIMAMNIAGSMLGGVLEYNSMAFGFSSLYLLGIVIYGTAWICATKLKN